MYVSSSLLSSENICGTRPCELGTQGNLNSLVFEWFSFVRVYIEVSPLFPFLQVCLFLSVLLLNWSLIFDMFLLF